MSVGAQLTPTVHNLMVSEKVVQGKKINVLPRKTPPKKEETAEKSEAPTETVKESVSETETPKSPEPEAKPQAS